MAAAFLDSRLELLISKKLVDDRKIVQQFLEFNGVAGSFSSRIDFCYLTGLLTKSVYSDLNLIRKIRNEFGHRVEPISFETPEIRSRCEQLQNNNTPIDAWPRLKFTNTCFGVLSSIDASIIRVNSFKTPVDHLWTREEKEKSYLNFLNKFNGVLDGMSPELLCSKEGKMKIFGELIDSMYDETKTGTEDH